MVRQRLEIGREEEGNREGGGGGGKRQTMVKGVFIVVAAVMEASAHVRHGFGWSQRAG